MKRSQGFTLIELMIVVLVIAVLAGIALSGYQKQVRKSRRAEAKQILADISLRQEKWRSNHATYGTCDDVMGVVCTTYNAGTALTYYTVAVTFPAAGTCASGQAKDNRNSFIVTGTPRAGTDQTKDTCSSLVLTNDCGTVTKTGTGSDASNCW
jgi:type IV pilus assembly protein PilE